MILSMIAAVSITLTNPTIEDDAYLLALAQIETGVNDHKTGPHGEVSRYQMKRWLWSHYSSSSDWDNPEVSREVALSHLRHIKEWLRERYGHISPAAVAGVWHYGEKDFALNPIGCTRSPYAKRFSNLVRAGQLPK